MVYCRFYTAGLSVKKDKHTPEYGLCIIFGSATFLNIIANIGILLIKSKRTLYTLNFLLLCMHSILYDEKYFYLYMIKILSIWSSVNYFHKNFRHFLKYFLLIGKEHGISVFWHFSSVGECYLRAEELKKVF